MKTITFFLIIFLFSCSGDNNSSTPFVDGYDIKLPVKAIYSSNIPEMNRVYAFTYDVRNRLIKTKVTGGLTATFQYLYDNFQLQKVVVNNTNTFTILYDEFGVINGVSNNGTTVPVTYDSATNNYFYDGHIFKMNSEGDITILESNTAGEMGHGGIWLGPFYSVLGYHSFAAFLTDIQMYTIGSRRPMLYINLPGSGYGQMAAHLEGYKYFDGGTADFNASHSYVSVWFTYKATLEYENIEKL